MKKIILMISLIFFIPVPLAHSFYTIDGKVNDWGIQLNAASKYKYYLDNNTPTGGLDIDYATEDNTDKYSGTFNVGPGWSGGNAYDAEAMYFDNDMDYAYIAIITGLPQFGATYPAGDIFIDTGKYQDPASPFYNLTKYGFGIDIDTSKLYAVNSWQNVVFPSHAISNPWIIGNNKVYLADVDLVYSTIQNTHYVLETRVPLTFLGLSANPGDPEFDVWTHWTMQCGNDYLNLHGDVNPIPEPASLTLFTTGLLMGLGFLRSRKF